MSTTVSPIWSRRVTDPRPAAHDVEMSGRAPAIGDGKTSFGVKKRNAFNEWPRPGQADEMVERMVDSE